ncbi:hypothetical protein P4J13_10840 [Bacillus anthracis]|uniref:hypothetical protein n=1 Tax=Bacillus TaxID=1386 RepID=UPI002378715E|nr:MULTISPECIES: hypothetical protein [Bacillus]MEB9504441.1 hypothetical protein [Bacillus anthracis]WDL91760.1 hypothetical protein JCR32_23145 [Bacillus sp. HNR-4]
MKRSKKMISSILAGTFLFGIAGPLVFNVKEAKAAENEVTENKFTYQEIKDLVELQNELQKHNISAGDIILGIQAELPENSLPAQPITDPNAPVQQGPKTQAAKVVAKQLIKNLQRVGKVSWDRSMRNYINKTPLPDSAKNTLKKYLAYQVVMETLNVVVNFSGTITDALSARLKSMGCPAWLADTAARAIVAILL